MENIESTGKVDGVSNKKIKHGWFSHKQYEISGGIYWSTPDGKRVLVTEVTSDRNGKTENSDVEYVGEVVDHLGRFTRKKSDSFHFTEPSESIRSRPRPMYMHNPFERPEMFEPKSRTFYDVFGKPITITCKPVHEDKDIPPRKSKKQVFREQARKSQVEQLMNPTKKDIRNARKKELRKAAKKEK